MSGAELVVAFVGGAFGGAIVTAVANLVIQWWLNKREDQWRFADIKPEAYASFAEALDAYLQDAKSYLAGYEPPPNRRTDDARATKVVLLRQPVGLAAIGATSSSSRSWSRGSPDRGAGTDPTWSSVRQGMRSSRQRKDVDVR